MRFSPPGGPSARRTTPPRSAGLFNLFNRLIDGKRDHGSCLWRSRSTPCPFALLQQERGRSTRIRQLKADRLPDGLTLERDRDLGGRSGHVWYRRALLCLIAVLPVLALLNVFGKRPTTSSAHTFAADLEVTA
jgi:hypothetical protein